MPCLKLFMDDAARPAKLGPVERREFNLFAASCFSLMGFLMGSDMVKFLSRGRLGSTSYWAGRQAPRLPHLANPLIFRKRVSPISAGSQAKSQEKSADSQRLL